MFFVLHLVNYLFLFLLQLYLFSVLTFVMDVFFDRWDYFSYWLYDLDGSYIFVIHNCFFIVLFHVLAHCVLFLFYTLCLLLDFLVCFSFSSLILWMFLISRFWCLCFLVVDPWSLLFVIVLALCPWCCALVLFFLLYHCLLVFVFLFVFLERAFFTALILLFVCVFVLCSFSCVRCACLFIVLFCFLFLFYVLDLALCS